MDFGLHTLAASKAFAGLDGGPYNLFCNDDGFFKQVTLPQNLSGSDADMDGILGKAPQMSTSIIPRVGKLPVNDRSFGPVRTKKQDVSVKPYTRKASLSQTSQPASAAGVPALMPAVKFLKDYMPGLPYKDHDRKMKHRLIDRARRRREKNSIEELKVLVTLEPRERPDKATVVASAVRTIKDLNAKVAALERQLRITPTTTQASRSSCEDDSVDLPDDDSEPNSPVPKLLPPSSPAESGESPSFGMVAMNNVLHGLASAGVASVIIDIRTSCIKDVNSRFLSISGFERSQLLDKKFSDQPLFGRHLSGSQNCEEPSQEQISHGIKVLSNGGSFKMLCRHASGKGVAVESVNTMFLLRGSQNVPYAVLSISTPDSRRVVDQPVSPSLNAVDFFVLLSSELNGLLGSSYLV